MYEVVKTDTNITWNSKLVPMITLADEYGGRAQIVEDDHCLVLLLKTDAGYKPTYWWFREAIEAINTAGVQSGRWQCSASNIAKTA